MDYTLLMELMSLPGVPGREYAVAGKLKERMAELGGEIEEDRLGNLIAHFPGQGPRVALAAHMDEVGFLVSKIEEEGFVRFSPLGGIEGRVLPSQKLTVHGRRDVTGVVGSVPPHLAGRDKTEADKVQVEDCFLDLGLPADEVRNLVRVGDPVTFAVTPWENEHVVFGKALDDRVGLFVMLEAVALAEKRSCDLYLLATVQEELGLRGIGAAVFKTRPEVVVALEGTAASDFPGVNLPANVGVTSAGKGTEIRITDRQMVADGRVVDYLSALAEKREIGYQVIVKRAGTTDAATAQVSAGGARVSVVSVPVRYIHGPLSLAYKNDIENSIRLMAAFLEEAVDL